MQNDEALEQDNQDDMKVKKVRTSQSERKQHSILPLIITLIGIFCYIGVILPSVFQSSSGQFDYTAFDMVLLLGGAVLVALGAYFWFTAKVKTINGKEAKLV